MHPLMRVMCLLLLAMLLPRLALSDLLLVCLGLLYLHAWHARQRMPLLLAGVWRIRFLLAAIAILYMGFTPGTPVWQGLPGISREGCIEGARRALVLVDLLFAVYLLIATTSPPVLAAALAQLLRPLATLGLPVDRVARRVSLTLATVPAIEARLRSERMAGKTWMTAFAATVSHVEDRATASTEAEGGAATLAWPEPRQWLWLLPSAAALFLWPA